MFGFPKILGGVLPLLAGCAFLGPVSLLERPFLAKYLPPGISMNDYVEEGLFGGKKNVGMKLAELGAHPGKNGELHDWKGNPIKFFPHCYVGGAGPPPGYLEKEIQLENLKKNFTVIEIFPDPELFQPGP